MWKFARTDIQLAYIQMKEKDKNLLPPPFNVIPTWYTVYHWFCINNQVADQQEQVKQREREQLELTIFNDLRQRFREKHGWEETGVKTSKKGQPRIAPALRKSAVLDEND